MAPKQAAAAPVTPDTPTPQTAATTASSAAAAPAAASPGTPTGIAVKVAGTPATSEAAADKGGKGSVEHLLLPETVVSRVDVSRMIRELAEIDDALHQASLRKGGQPTEMPRPSRLLEETATANNVNLLLPTDRQALLKVLNDLKRSAPTIHMSFASNPSGTFTGRLLLWLRENIHPYILLQVGLQPELAAGCTVRTLSKRYDFSVRKRLESSKDLLTELLNQAKDEPIQPSESAPVPSSDPSAPTPAATPAAATPAAPAPAATTPGAPA